MNLMFYFLLALTAALAATANARGIEVVDTSGTPLVVGDSYYVYPSYFSPVPGGLTLTPLGGKTCPLLVGLENWDSNYGIPVRFSVRESDVSFVHESENLNIEMDIEDTRKTCGNSAYWRVTPSLKYMEWFVEAGPKPEAGEDSSFIQMKKANIYSNGYYIAVCPEGNDCKYVWPFEDKDRVLRLALRSKPYAFNIKKATGTETSSKTMSSI